ncbi:MULTISPECIES: CDP-alcohol phosphatidyltransferase family protein [unclassified Paracoccus (in: a-proteobacteria)]|uniref:CDP-alcohol phosphatidyltransferase family protein n=1 Tax=unclassified Paracoccus (in: a-proteobacteria) TaxID=2688777 RepID=UPI0021E19695|nr:MULTISPECIES: CDP-alcohol phosphatidyltransferase family protein [unclassified Paracoccus (in: a-proteobacteria)]UXU76633.1 CDP-alcohol phosphatidyltransferase family protein [Paracoccus sp. SMMA_5]UXU82521.1 CDP-alcohol phosphatidyltransferase family protein [Paracoccus sp. SMMA_5_TC]
MSAPQGNRRPLASRQTGWAQAVSRWLAGTGITPNRISQLGLLAAVLAGLALWRAGLSQGGARALWLLAGAGLCQLRLLCNLFDGMVAIGAGRASPDGGFWNEFPDRLSDMAILMGVALGLGVPGLGWAAVSFAFLTAYLRELGVNCGAGADFAGPMAKQHRMALITLAALASLAEPLWQGQGQILRAALWAVALGAALTAVRRAVRLRRRLLADGRPDGGGQSGSAGG